MSEKDMDDLLAQLKTEFEPKRESSKNGNKSSAQKQNKPPQNAASMDRMLAELRADLESGRGRPNSTPTQPTTPAKSSQTSRNNRSIANVLIF